MLFFVLHGFYGAVKEQFEQPCPRPRTPPVGRFTESTSAPLLALWGAALLFLHGFYGAVKEQIRTARAPRPRNAPVGRFTKNFMGCCSFFMDLSSSTAHQAAPYGCCSFCFARILWGSKRRDSNSSCPAPRNAPVGRFSEGLSKSYTNTLAWGAALFFCFAWILWSSKRRIRTARAPRPRNAPVGRF